MQDTAFKYQVNVEDIKTFFGNENLDYLGQGSYGKVQRVYSEKYGVSAAKIFHLTGTTGRYSSSMTEIKKEADRLAFASHENIVRFQAFCHWTSYVAIIMQYEVNGSLHDLLQERSVSDIPFKLRCRMAYEVNKALVFLHNLEKGDRMTHGDLKSSNILLNEDLRIRVADFGAADIGTKTCDQTRQHRQSASLTHSVIFTAPEFLQDIYTRRTTAMDVYSFGRLIYQLLIRRIPFESHQHPNLSVAIVNGAEPEYGDLSRIRRTILESLDDDLRLFDYLHTLMNNCCDRTQDNRPKMLDVEKEMKELLSTIPAVTMLKAVTFVLNQMKAPRRESPEESRVCLNRFNRQ